MLRSDPAPGATLVAAAQADSLRSTVLALQLRAAIGSLGASGDLECGRPRAAWETFGIQGSRNQRMR